jgi:hypothetical protein
VPIFDLSEDSGACVSSNKLTPAQLLLERVIVKLFKHYEIPLQITDSIRAAVKSKLWRMGRLLSKCGGGKRQQQLAKWKEGDEATWDFEVCRNEVARQLLKKKHDHIPNYNWLLGGSSSKYTVGNSITTKKVSC